MAWSQAAPFVAACSYGVSQVAGQCSDACAAAVAPFSADCFSPVVANEFFIYAPGIVRPDAQQASAFYETSLALAALAAALCI
ncbi:hypothetical protein C2E20_5641 [Micractinium conductrix]|uniref:Uncharacterized protein n=1 Tax=Micractinium conductrix TaxID=554055 RepID=A0A2P6V9S4_9CHLO|nr:hypothetical protein C2E20_5641 [Micractinium conductrix]|eukprot:PSC70839.1 hypothetical protein C2E20_5641 [Micractinium conductrix]